MKSFSVAVSIGGNLNPSLGAAVKAAQAQISRLGAVVAGTNARVGATVARIGEAQRQNARRLEVARGNLVEAGGLAYGLQRVLSAPIKAATEFETLMLDIGQKADLSGDRLTNLAQAIRNVARQTNQSAPAIGRGVDFLIGMGASPETAIGASPTIGRTATAYNASVEDLARTGFALTDNLKVPVSHFAVAMDALAKAGKEGGFELKDMAREFPKLTASAQALGMTGVSAVADLAAALEVARKGAADGSEAANNMQNFLAKINSKETVKNFSEFGVDVVKELKIASKKGVSPIEHMLDVINRITKGGRTELLNRLFSDMQVQNFLKPMLANMQEYRRIRSEALKAQGTVEADYERRIKTTQGAVGRLTAAFENMSASIGAALLPSFVGMADRLASIANRVSDLAERFPNLTAGIVKTATALVGLRIAGAALTWLGLVGKGSILSLAYGLLWLGKAATLGLASRLVSVATGVRAIAFAAALGGAGRLRAMAVGLLALSAVGGPRAALGAIAGSVASFGRSLLGFPLTALRAIGAVLAGIGGLAGAAIIAITAALAALGVWVYNNWNGITSFFEGFIEGFSNAFGSTPKGWVDGLVSSIQSVWRFVSDLLGPINATNEEWKSWGATVGGVVAGAVNAVANGIGRVVGLFTAAYEKAVALKNALAGLVGGGGGPLPSVQYDAMGNVAGTRALGGPVVRGLPYLVGERGPEIFVPSVSGHIETNDTLNRLASPQAVASASSGSGGGARGGTVTYAPTFNINGTQNPNAIRQEIERYMMRLQSDQHALLSD